MFTHVAGIHHITSIASDPKKTVDFYTRILGLRLVKKSVNQDEVSTYHLFFGDNTGEPGMDLTFFTFQPIMQGLQGVGQVTKISLAVPEESLEFWQKRFDTNTVDHETISEHLGTSRITFYDFDQQCFELVGVPQNEFSKGAKKVWTTSEISESQAIGYFYSATLSVPHISLVEPVLKNVFGYSEVKKQNNISQYKVGDGVRAAYIEVDATPTFEEGINAAGTVHHIAFEVADETELLEARQKVVEVGLYPTEVINRYYFKSVYFRTRAGILFELATAGPGFTADEKESELGKTLALPPFLESRRKEIEAGLEPID